MGNNPFDEVQKFRLIMTSLIAVGVWAGSMQVSLQGKVDGAQFATLEANVNNLDRDVEALSNNFNKYIDSTVGFRTDMIKILNKLEEREAMRQADNK